MIKIESIILKMVTQKYRLIMQKIMNLIQEILPLVRRYDKAFKITPDLDRVLCRKITADLSEYFGLYLMSMSVTL